MKNALSNRLTWQWATVPEDGQQCNRERAKVLNLFPPVDSVRVKDYTPLKTNYRLRETFCGNVNN